MIAKRSWALFLLRPFFLPNWKFFQSTGGAPRLRYRVFTQGSWQTWFDFPQPPLISWTRLFHNPAGNSYLAIQTELDRLIEYLAEAPSQQQVRDFVSYRILTQAVAYEICSRWHEKLGGDTLVKPAAFEFEIRLGGDQADSLDHSVGIKSQVFSL